MHYCNHTNEVRTTVKAVTAAALSFVSVIICLMALLVANATYDDDVQKATFVEETTTTQTTTETTTLTTTTTTSTTTTATITTTEVVTTTEIVTEEVEVAYVEEYVEEYVDDDYSGEPEYEAPVYYEWGGQVLTPQLGCIYGPNGGSETYYNMYMGGVIQLVQSECGLYYDYWTREDGVKMYGDYVMVAADFDLFPRGTVVPTSLGTGLVCDTGGFAGDSNYPIDGVHNWLTYQLDIAVTW